MPLTLTYFESPGSSSRRFGTTVREEVVVGRAKGLSKDETLTKEAAHTAVLAALIADGRGMGTPHPAASVMTLRELLVYGIDGDQCRFLLMYSTFTGGVLSSLVININSQLEMVQSYIDPATGRVIEARFTTAGGADDEDNQPVGQDTITFNYLRPVVVLSGTRIFYGRTTVDAVIKGANVLGCVNDATFLGRGPGRWLMRKFETSQQRYSGVTAVRMEAASKGVGTVNEDWRVLGMLYNQQLGKYIRPDSDKVSAAIRTAPYKFGKITAGPGGGAIYDPLVDGFTVIGPYPTTNFSTIWANMDVETPTIPPFGWDLGGFGPSDPASF